MTLAARATSVVVAALFTLGAAAAQDLQSFEKRVSVKTLANGLTLVVCERPEAPIFSFYTHVDSGSDREVPGITGLAHMFEHMAFKGTDTIGSRNFTAEKAALAKVETTYAAYEQERLKSVGKDEKVLAAREQAWRDAMAAADGYVVPNAFGEVIEREGGAGLNATTYSDYTAYYYSLPANRLELWAYLESERFLKPVMREFYRERGVVMEERRMRTESNPVGRLVEQFIAASFTAHPYGQAGVGWPSDLQSFSATDAMAFFNKHYVPANMTMAIVGDVKAAEVFAVAERYFGRLPKRDKPEPLRTVEPPQRSERQVVIRDASQPVYLEGYHKPGYLDPDEAVYDVISDLMTSGRTSRLYRSLVRDQKIAAQAGGFGGFPGNKYPNSFIVYAFTAPGHSNEEVQRALRAEIERLKSQDVSDDELAMVKTRAKAALIEGLGDNEGLASGLGFAQARYGDWREVFRGVDKIDKVTKADIRRVAQATFVAANRTVGYIETAKPDAKGGR
jgi:predicted Zn-dependent peptidase